MTRMVINEKGSVGIGTSAPAARLDVAGSVKVGESTDGCSVTNKGSIRYNNSTSVLEFCNGVGWNIIQAAACTDATPDTFTFSDQANAALTTLVTSDIVQVNGLNCSVPVTISGPGSPEFRICADSSCTTLVQGWTSAPSSLLSGQYLQLRQTTDTVGGSTYQATVKLGAGASVWGVTTAGDCTSSPAPGTVCSDGTIYAGMSPDAGGVPMYTTRCNAGATWNGTDCSNTGSGLSWSNGIDTGTTTGFTSSVAGQYNSAGLAALTTNAYPYSAAQYFESLVADGHTDWYLPAENELTVLYNNRSAIGNFNDGQFWSSTEDSATLAEPLRFSNGDGFRDTKTNSKNVRCVRR